MLKIFAFVVTLAVVVSTALTASAAVAFEDDFEASAPGPLSGQSAQSGQTYGAFSFFGTYGSFDVSTAHGFGGTQGAGTASSADFSGNSVSLGTSLTSGVWTIDMDLQTQAPGFGGATTPLKQWWLQDSASGNVASIYWESDGDIGFEGLGLTPPKIVTPMDGTGSMHQTMTIDFDSKEVSIEWYDNSNPLSGGTQVVGTYSVAFAPNTLHLWGRGESNVINSGYDNIRIGQVPEPTGILLMGMGIAALIARGRRRGA